MAWEQVASQVWERESGLAILRVSSGAGFYRWEIFLEGVRGYWGTARYQETAQTAADRCWVAERLV